jgi:hypothetical protein
MAGVFQNIDPPPPSPRTLWYGGRGVGVNILEDVRHSSVPYVFKYFVRQSQKDCRTDNREKSATSTVRG